jgi:hypothetical protein
MTLMITSHAGTKNKQLAFSPEKASSEAPTFQMNLDTFHNILRSKNVENKVPNSNSL